MLYFHDFQTYQDAQCWVDNSGYPDMIANSFHDEDVQDATIQQLVKFTYKNAVEFLYPKGESDMFKAFLISIGEDPKIWL